MAKGPCTRARKNASKISRGKKPVATRVKKLKIQSGFPFAMANKITTFSTLRSCNQEYKTPKHGQHILFAKLSDSSCGFKLLINY